MMECHVKTISVLLLFATVCVCAKSGTGLSKIYIANNTPLILKINSFEATDPKSACVRTSVDVVAPWANAEVVKVIDQAKAKSGSDRCQVEVSIGDKRYVMSVDNLSRARKKGEHKKLPSTPFLVMGDGLERIVTCHSQVFAKKDGGYDLWFIFSVKPNEKCHDPSGFTVLQWNIWMKRIIIAPHDKYLRRAPEVPRVISEMFKNCLPDVVCFNEAFSPVAFAKVKKGMKKLGYKYSTGVLGSLHLLRFKPENGGVVIFSRWPITKEKEKRFGKLCLQEDCFADKGVKYARIKKNGKNYHVFATHIQSGAITMINKARKSLKKARSKANKAGIKKAQENVKKNREKLKEYQRRQFAVVRKFIDDQNIDKDDLVLIVGDLNINQGDFATRFSKTLNATLPNVLYQYEGHGGTHIRHAYIDYLLYSNTHRKPTKAYNKILHPTMPKAWVSTTDDKYYRRDSLMFVPSDHKPILGYFQF